MWVCWHTIKSSKYIHHGHSLSAALLSKLHLHCQHVLVRGDSNSIAKMIARTRSRLTLVAASPQAPNPNLLSDLEGLWGQWLPYHSIIKTGHKKNYVRVEEKYKRSSCTASIIVSPKEYLACIQFKKNRKYFQKIDLKWSSL